MTDYSPLSFSDLQSAKLAAIGKPSYDAIVAEQERRLESHEAFLGAILAQRRIPRQPDCYKRMHSLRMSLFAAGHTNALIHYLKSALA